jgi:histidine ammonia-lyase
MITLTGHTLTVEEMKKLLLEGEGVTACPTSMQKVAECREVVEKIVED